MKARKKTTAKPHPLKGMYLHTFKDDDRKELHYQGKILDVDDDICLVQLFSWFSGDPTQVEALSKKFIYSLRCKLYTGQEAWIYAAELQQKREDIAENSTPLKPNRPTGRPVGVPSTPQQLATPTSVKG